MIRHAGIVIPVHNEVELLARCLDALRQAGRPPGVDVQVVFVLDRCTDGSADVLAAAPPLGYPTSVIEVDEANAGAARAAGCAALLQRFAAARLWLATTDADSAVGPSWLRRQLRYAQVGYDAVAGTVTIDDWSSYPPESRHRYLREYRQQWGHGHVHGANLGVRADAYSAVGGFPALSTGEDVELVAALTRADRKVAWAHDVPVLTSARRRGRAPGGLSHVLQELSPVRL